MRFNRRKYRRIWASFAIFLLVFSLFMPTVSHGEQQGQNLDLNTIEEDLILEKGLEDSDFNESEELADNDLEVSGSDGLPRIHDGLEVDKPSFDKQEDSTQEKVIMEGKVEKKVLQSFEKEEMVHVIIHMKTDSTNKASIFKDAEKNSKREERLMMVQNHLQLVAEKSQSEVLKKLDNFSQKGKAKDIQPLWIVNGIAASVTKDAVEELEKRDDIEKILMEKVFEVPEVTLNETSPRLPEWGLEKVNATNVWARYGIDGEGIVVGIMDTGVEGSHEALAHNYRGRNGEHQYSWADFSGDGYATPQDGNGHGTHVAGSAVGGGEGEPIGVAPGAEWIAAKIFNDGGYATESGIHQAFQWFMAPGGDPSMAPHVVNNSWGNSNTGDTTFREDVQAWIAAGIFPLFAAGNDGPVSNSIGAPGSFPESFAVGATDVNDQIAWFSSRGPVYWGDKRYIKPDVSAPGHQIYSAIPGNGYGVKSGTSMATPHVAGVIALILQSNPNLSIDDLTALLKETARTEIHMGPLPNDLYGTGIVNAYQAVTSAAFAGTVQGTITDENGSPIAATIRIEEENLDIPVSDDGTFEFILREGTHEVEVESFGYQADTFTLTLEKDQVVEVDWQLTKSDQFEINGIVTGSAGNPVPFAYVRIQNTPLSVGRTNENGEFSFEGVPEGDYRLTISGKGISSKNETVTVNSDLNLDFTVTDSTFISDENWATGNNNPTRNAISNEDISTSHLQEALEIPVSGNIVFSSPVVNDDTVVIVTESGNVEAFNIQTGERKWSFRTGGMNRSTPTISNDYVYVTGGQDQTLYALNINSGVVEWSVKLENLPVYESPIYDEGVLYLTSSFNGATKVYALDATNGQTIWTTKVAANSYSGAALAGDQLFIGTVEDGKMIAISKQDGSVNWTFEITGGGFASFPVVVENTVYAFSTNFETRGTLWAIDAETGEEVWHVEGIGDTQAATPVVYEDIILVSSASVPSLKAFDRHTGALLWANKNVSTTVNNGVVASNGVFFIVDSTFSLKAIDVFSGEMVAQWSLAGSSSSTPAITAGQVIVPTQRGVTVFSAPGLFSGTIQDGEGNPVTGTVRIVGTDMKADADGNGKFALSLLPGEYEVRIGEYGLEQVQRTFTIHSGYEFNQAYTLQAVEAGQLSGTVVDKRSGEAISGILVTVQDTPLETTTDENGHFHFESIYAGNYDVQFQGSGYVENSLPIIVEEGVETELFPTLDPIDVAVLDDYKSTITNLLNLSGIPAEEVTWEEIVGNVENYNVLYLNGAYASDGWTPEKEDMDTLLSEALEADVSLIFTDAWGPNYGSISDLVKHYQDPAVLQSDYTDAVVSLEIIQEHPIFEGFEIGDTIRILNSGKASWFTGYSGRDLATVHSSRIGKVGSGIGIKAVSQNSAHILLANNSTASWNLPTQHWPKDQHTLLINSVNYLLEDAVFGELKGQIVDQSGNPLQASVQVLETGASVMADESGQFALFHDEGTFNLEVRLTGYETEVVEVTVENGNLVTETIELVSSMEGKLSGIVTDSLSMDSIGDVQIKLKDSTGEIVAETVTNSNGSYEFSNLPAAVYGLEFIHNDYVLAKDEIEIKGPPVELNKTLIPEPSLAILGDRSYGTNLEEIFAEYNIDVTDYSSIQTLTEEISTYDVVFFNDKSGITKATIEAFEKAADNNGVSIIYGDTYFSGGGIYTLNSVRKDPATRDRINIRSSAAQYVIGQESPLFGDRAVGDIIEILVPDGSRVSAFDNYSGFSLADIKHAETDVHGQGIAYKPRTGDSMELLMSGHSAAIAHDGEDYTEEGLQLFINSVIWAAYENFNVFRGNITDENGETIEAEVSLEIDGVTLSANTTHDNSEFEIAAPDGEAVVTVSAYGYQTETFEQSINDSLEPMNLELSLKEDVGQLKGHITNKSQFNGIEDVHVNIVGYPREGYTDSLGYYQIDNIEPGTYELEIKKDGFLVETLTIEINPSEVEIYDTALRPSPTVGIIVDVQSSSYVSLAEYLGEKGYNTIPMYFDDLDMLEQVDLVFVNADHNNDLIPDEKTFKQFLEAIDNTETSVIWTGQHGGKGSIRYLYEYLDDPGEEYRGNGSGSQTVTILEEHPIFEGVPETFEFQSDRGYYYGFDQYSGTMLADLDKVGVEEEGYMIGFKGRTMNSVEILLGGMTFGYGFHPGDSNFDENLEKILNNSILWAIEHEESYAGEIRSQVINNFDIPIQAEVTVMETDQTIKTDSDGNFFVALAEGTYTLQIDGFGHISNEFDVQVVNGEVLQESFELEAEAVGELKGVIRASDTSDLIAGANIEILGTPLRAETDDKGSFRIVVPEGSYDVRVTASGYQPQISTITITTGQTTNVNVMLNDSQAIAVIASSLNNGRITPFLESYGYEVVYYDRDEIGLLTENIAEFALVIFNDSGNRMSEADFLGLIEASDEAQVSMIFANQFGAGSINHLRDYLGDPSFTDTDYQPNAIQYEVLSEHPIFRGYEVGEQITILERPDANQQYGVFDQYSGTTVADLTHSVEGRLGSGIAYDFRSSGHVHLLLGSLSVSSYGHPEERWTEDTKNIYINAIDWAINASLGEISGVVSDENGEPIQGAMVKVENENITVQTNDQGRYSVGVSTGEHTVSISAIGYESKQENVVVENIGDVVELDVTLNTSERMSIFGQVLNQSAEEGLADVAVIARDELGLQEYTTMTDSNGTYQLTDLLAGEYEITFEKEGYHPVRETISIADGENKELNVSISAYNIAVLGDFKGEITKLLNEYDIAAEAVDWGVTNHVGLYDVIIVNSSEAETSEVEALISASDEQQTSLVFLDTWGTSGSISLLEQVFGYPTMQEQGYDEGEVFIAVDNAEHPIFKDFETERIKILAERSPYATFTDYRGTTLANLAVNEEGKGTSIAYTFRSNEHMHLLLSAFAVNNIVGPDRGWTEDGKKLFVQSVAWAKDGEGQLPDVPVWKKDYEEGKEGSTIVVGGKAERNIMIRVYDGTTLLAETMTNGGGVFQVKLELPEGEYNLIAEAVNEDGATQSDNAMTLIVHSKSKVTAK